ncbi:hypothetical protein HOLleu_26430 [Holothuria leucospilota]|uniref:Uncharacterized protein n=1 Tax=Holothuria leucospilota TaxID=206669 RepID=A0A9Q1BNV4_HOLLE|nr:hypothetical protein HOLleu_26430 [Holothuria leucospilota]
MLKHPDIISEVKNGHKSDTPGLTRDYCDGSYFANSALFSDDPCSLQVQLYVDDFETANPLGTYIKKRKLCACYFILGNIPPRFRSKLMLIQLLWLCNSDFIKLYRLQKVVSPLISHLALLERVGLQVKVDNVVEVFRGTATMIVADNLASHSMGGFNESFSGFRICRFCMCTSQELMCGHPPRNLMERSSAVYDEHVKLVKNDEQLSTTYGVKKNSPFNDLRYFHVTRGLPPD